MRVRQVTTYIMAICGEWLRKFEALLCNIKGTFKKDCIRKTVTITCRWHTPKENGISHCPSGQVFSRPFVCDTGLLIFPGSLGGEDIYCAHFTVEKLRCQEMSYIPRITHVIIYRGASTWIWPFDSRWERETQKQKTMKNTDHEEIILTEQTRSEVRQRVARPRGTEGFQTWFWYESHLFKDGLSVGEEQQVDKNQ